MRSIAPAVIVAIAALILPDGALAATQVLRPDRTVQDGWATRPVPPRVHEVIDDDVLAPTIPPGVPTTDFAFGDLPRQRFEVGFSNPDPAAADFYDRGSVSVFLGQQVGTKTDYALRVTTPSGFRRIVAQRNGFAPIPGGFRDWARFALQRRISRAEANSLTLAVRISPTSRGTGSRRPLAKIYAAYVTVTPQPEP